MRLPFRAWLVLVLTAPSWSSVLAASPAGAETPGAETPVVAAPGAPADLTVVPSDATTGAAASIDAAHAVAPPHAGATSIEATPHALLEARPDKSRGDLWQRIRNGFGLPDVQGDRVRTWERYYAGKPEYVQRMTARGSRYLFHIVEEVEKRGMPLELALLPFAESAFNPLAMSSAKASGMWQFMPATGKDFSLRQNLFRDDRRDVLASTRAALDYLQRLHRLMGDWHLALAAYNWGQGNVQRAMAINRSQGKSTGFESLQMPDETKNYVPKLQAIKNFVMTPDALGMQLPALDNHPYFRSVSIDRDIDVAKAADLAGLSLEDFQALNPQMNKPLILAAATPQVLLPYDNANRFVQELQQTRAPLATWTAWVAPSTLKPADAARQVGMTEALLREVNHIPERMLVKAGSTLLVQRDAKMHLDVASHLADNATIMLTPELRPMRRLSFKAGRKGESVASVAARHGVSASALAGWNKMQAGGHFKAGQQVVVMLPVLAARAAAGRGATPATAAPGVDLAARPADHQAERQSGKRTAQAVAGPVVRQAVRQVAKPVARQAAGSAERKVVKLAAADVAGNGKSKKTVAGTTRRDAPAKLRGRETDKARATPRRA